MMALIPIILKFLPYIVDAGKTIPQLITFLSEIRKVASRDKLWTPEQEATFDAKVESVTSSPAWQLKD